MTDHISIERVKNKKSDVIQGLFKKVHTSIIANKTAETVKMK